uniref:Chromo domain-containing protein n=1 Tax=Ditylenchus dipsaci TaxID=166011 RepID=A0A915CP13_9BILA
MSQQKDIKEEIEKPSSQDSQGSADEDDAMRTVERILRKRIQETCPQYRVKWLGLPHSENTWVPEEDLDCPELIEEYKEKSVGRRCAGGAKQGKKRSIQSAKPALSVSQPAPKRNKTASAVKKKDGADAFYEVESILDKMIKNGCALYRVKWKTFSKPTWEPASNLEYCDLLSQYEEGLKKKRASKPVASTKSASKPSATITPVVPAGILKQMPPRSLSYGMSTYHPRVSPHVHFQDSPTSKSDTEIFGQLVVRKLNDMSPLMLARLK